MKATTCLSVILSTVLVIPIVEAQDGEFMLRVLTDVGIDGVEQLKNQAERGDTEAQRRMGLLYLTGGDAQGGESVAPDPEEAAKWFRRAAVQGDTESQLRLGVAYYLGEGVQQDYHEAARWLRPAAEKGNAEAQTFLGSVYTLSTGSWERNYEESAQWFQMAADQGDTQAQVGLARLYQEGVGVEQDYVRAYKWINLAVRGSRTTLEVQQRTRLQRTITDRMTPNQIREATELRQAWEADRLD